MDFINSPLYLSIKNFLLLEYQAASSLKDAEILLETLDLYEKIQQLYPGIYGIDDLSLLLEECDYQRQPIGNDLKYVWLLKKNTQNG